MSYKNPEDKTNYMADYNPKYYVNNRVKILKYRKGRREQDRENWRRWWAKKLDKRRKEKISLGQIYKTKKMFR